MIRFVFRCVLSFVVSSATEPIDSWLHNFGHDAYRYPSWVSEQMHGCSCSIDLKGGRKVACTDQDSVVDWSTAKDITWCVAKHFLLSQMPTFDLYFLPPSVSVEGSSMLDDNIAFALMAWNASKLSPQPPVHVVLPYVLPYASYQESRANWRPVFFAKYMQFVANKTTSVDIINALIGGDGQQPLMNWTNFKWKDFPGSSQNKYELGPFAPSTSPPVVGPFDFLAYGYGSCTGWSTFLTSALKAVGVPARQVGTPCWNTGIFSGLASDNPNVSQCWGGGPSGGPYGGVYLNNHNWVEYWDNTAGDWQFLDVATSSSKEVTWFCGTYKDGCECSSNAGKASKDHEIFAPTWSPAQEGSASDGGPVLDVGTDLKLTTGELVSPLVWSPRLTAPIGNDIKDVGLRVVNRTSFYRCQTSASDGYKIFKV